MNKVNLHCIGDSHTSFFSGYNRIQVEYPRTDKSVIKSIKTYRLGAPLAYNFSEFKSTTSSYDKVSEILSKLTPAKDMLMFCFGEIDCRAHIVKQRLKTGRPLLDIVENCVNRYLEGIFRISVAGFKVGVWNVVPTAMNVENDAHEIPYAGSWQERNEAAQIFNKLLAQKSKEFGFYFLDISSILMTEQLQSRSEFFFDEIHLNCKMLPTALAILKSKIPNVNISKGDIAKIKLRNFLISKGIVTDIDDHWLR